MPGTAAAAGITAAADRARHSSAYAWALDGAYRETGVELVLGRERRCRSSLMSLPVKEDDDDIKLGLMDTTANLAKALIGAGVLGIPFSFAAAGLSAGAIIAGVSLMTMGTAIVITQFMDENKDLARALGVQPSAVDWPFLGFAAFGDAGRTFCSVIFVWELWFLLLSSIVVNGVHMNILVPGMSRSTGIFVSGSLSFLTLYSPRWLSFALSIFGILAVVGSIVSLGWSATAMPAWASDEGITYLNVGGLPVAIGMIQFCFVAHTTVPSVYRKMREPEKFPQAAMMAFAFSCIFYCIVGFGAFFIYGSRAEPSFMANLGRDLKLHGLPGMSFLCTFCTLCFFVSVQNSFSIFAETLLEAVESYLDISWRGDSVKAAWRLAFTAGIIAVAIVLQDCMAPLKGFTGCFCATCTCLLLPLSFALKMGSGGPCMKLGCFIGFAWGMFVLLYGTYANALDLIHIVESPSASNSTAVVHVDEAARPSPTAMMATSAAEMLRSGASCVSATAGPAAASLQELVQELVSSTASVSMRGASSQHGHGHGGRKRGDAPSSPPSKALVPG